MTVLAYSPLQQVRTTEQCTLGFFMSLAEVRDYKYGAVGLALWQIH